MTELKKPEGKKEEKQEERKRRKKEWKDLRKL